MLSIFDLKTNVSELSSTNQGTSQMQYDQHPPTRDVTGNSFPNGAIHIRWQTSGQKWWMPTRSYLRIRGSLSKAGGLPLLKSDGVAPNMDLCAGLFQSLEFRINDKTVSRVSDFVPQVDALEYRLSKSRSWLDGVGNSINFWNEDVKERINDVSADGSELTPNENKTLVNRLALGFDALNTIAYTDATSLLTFADGGGAGVPDLNLVLPVGSIIQLPGALGAQPAGSELRVIAVTSPTTLVIENNLIGGDIVAAVVDFNRVDVNVENSRRVTNFEMIWTPPLSVFKVPHAMPSGKYELILNPQTSTAYKRYSIESIGANKAPSVDFDFNIDDMYFYCNVVEGPRADDVTYLLDLTQTRCQAESMAGVTGFQQKSMDVSPSTYALTVAYQDGRVGNDTRASSTKFKAYDAGTVAISQELNLNRFFINYAGQNLPSPDADPSFVIGTDRTTQRYLESQIYSGAYFDTGGSETIEEYHDRGAYYYFAWPRDGTDRSTRVNVHQQFNAGTDLVNMRLLLFDHSKQIARIRVQDGRVVDVQVEDA